MLLFYSASYGQTSSFEGVYLCDNPAAVLVLHATSAGISGFVSDGTTADKLSCTRQAELLVLLSIEHPENGSSYATLDQAGNIWITDNQLRVYYFTRSAESAKEVFEALEKVQLQMAGGSTPGAQRAQGAHSYSGEYANKKFLHLYTGNGYTEKWAYYLYDTGIFIYRGSNSYLSGGYYDFSAATSGNDAGTYIIDKQGNQDVLVLRWNNGNQTRLTITQNQQGYFLNNEKYFLVGLNEYE
jgi:hypothetical protein